MSEKDILVEQAIALDVTVERATCLRNRSKILGFDGSQDGMDDLVAELEKVGLGHCDRLRKVTQLYLLATKEDVQA